MKEFSKRFQIEITDPFDSQTIIIKYSSIFKSSVKFSILKHRNFIRKFENTLKYLRKIRLWTFSLYMENSFLNCWNFCRERKSAIFETKSKSRKIVWNLSFPPDCCEKNIVRSLQLISRVKEMWVLSIWMSTILCIKLSIFVEIHFEFSIRLYLLSWSTVPYKVGTFFGLIEGMYVNMKQVSSFKINIWRNKKYEW